MRSILALCALLIIVAIAYIALDPRERFRSLPNNDGEVKLLFVGDIMLDRTMRKIGEAKGYDFLFSCVKDLLARYDLVIGNLEGPVTPRESVSLATKPGEPGNTTFTFSPESVRALALANIRLVNLGNNHILDFGREGIESTVAYLKESGVGYFGEPYGDNTATVEINDRRLSFISFNQFLGQANPQKTIEAIWGARRESDLVAVYAHWGDEYEPATEYQKALAQRFVDAGADIVIGSHPHVIQESEMRDGKHIFYSLGNFVFDQYWIPEVRRGAGIEVTLGAKDRAVREELFDLDRTGTVCPA